MRAVLGSKLNSRVLSVVAWTAFAVAMATADSASAQTTAYAVGQGSPNNVVIGIPVTASIGGSCGFSTAPNASHNFPDLDTGFLADTSFVLNCNGASRIAVVSANGGLKTAAAAVPGYSTLAPYSVALHVVGNGGLTSDGSCAVADLTATAAAPCTFRGPVTPSVGLKLNGPSTAQVGSYIRVSAPVYSGAATLVASSAYADTLTVTLSASL